MSQDFVQLSELLQLLRGFIETIQPFRISSYLDEIIHVQVDQIGALVSCCCLQGDVKRDQICEVNVKLIREMTGAWIRSYHDADVVSVVQRQGSIHLQQVVLRPEKALQVLWVEAHHEGNVVQATEGCKCILKYRLRPGVHFTDLKNLVSNRNTSIKLRCLKFVAHLKDLGEIKSVSYLFFRDKSAWSVT